MSTPSDGGRAAGPRSDQTWADALLDGDDPVRDSLVPPALPSKAPASIHTSATPRSSYAPPPVSRSPYAQTPTPVRLTAETAVIAEAPVPESAYPDASVSPWAGEVDEDDDVPRASFDLTPPVMHRLVNDIATPPTMPPPAHPVSESNELPIEVDLSEVQAAPLVEQVSAAAHVDVDAHSSSTEATEKNKALAVVTPAHGADLEAYGAASAAEVERIEDDALHNPAGVLWPSDDPPPPPAAEVLAALDQVEGLDGPLPPELAEPELVTLDDASSENAAIHPFVAAAVDPHTGDVPDLADTSDLVELEALDEAFTSVFMVDATESARDVALISATTGDLVYPPPADVALRTDTPLIPPPLPTAPQAPLARRRELLPPRGEVVLGIDLGTTYTCAAVVEAKHASVLASRWGSPTIPSVVAILPDGRTLVGESALRYTSDPRRVIVGSKRIFGRAFHSPIVQEAREHFAYEVVEGPGGDAAVRIDGKIVDLEMVSAAILREIRESASLQIEGMVNRAVITCPAHFNERQRESIRVAGEMAGFHVERVLSEPTAAALHFGLGLGMAKRRVLVYDLGGGTFDVSLLEVDGDTFEVIGTGGDTFLGGMDFDACIADVVVEAFLEKEHIDARSDPVAVARILEFAERAKRELSDRTSTIVQIDHLTVQPHAPRAITVPIRRARVEELWTPLIDHTLAIVEQMLTRTGVSPSEIHEVLLVGGQSRTPLVQKRMEQLFGRKLPRDVNPEEAIALGAAQLGDTLAHASNVTLVDVLPMSIGVGLPGGRYKRILERETRLPAERSYTLRSTRDDQSRFEVALFQGEDENIHNDEPLGVVELRDLPKGPKGSVAVTITLRVTSEQVLEVEARENKTGRSIRAQLATQHTTQSIRRKLGLRGSSSQDLPRPRRARKRPTGVWGWLTSLFRRG